MKENGDTMELTVYLIVCPLVFLAGLVDSIAGGGGLISLPAYFLAGIPPHLSIGTNKLSSSIGTAISTFRFCRNKSVDWGLAVPSIVLALTGSALGAQLALLVDEDVMKKILLVILPIVAFYIFRNKNLNSDVVMTPLPRKKLFVIISLVSFAVATYDGFYGPGTGTFLLLLYTGLGKMDIRIASGNTKLVNLSSNIAALVTFLINGKILLPLGLTAALFSIAGHFIGSGLVLKNGYKIVKPIILVVLVLLFISLVKP